jgi:nucleoid DNA-binding protein
LIFHRVDGTIPKQDIYSAIGIICTELSDLLISDEPVRVEKFGTLSPYVGNGHLYRELGTGKLLTSDDFRSVKFHPHAVLRRLISERRVRFLVDKPNKKR